VSGGFSQAHPVLPADSAALGVVWTPPEAPGPALQELNRIHALGATAVRLTSPPPADTIVVRADTLGLTLFVDLPVSYVAAGALSDSLRRASPVLDRLRALARRHRSLRYVGLARAANTTVPAACSTLAAWTDRLHAAPAPLRTYYVTPFPAGADRCAEAVDRPLLDTRAWPRPVVRWSAWADEAPRTGIGALGTWTRPGAAPGLRVPHSPEQQARYLERSLSRLLDTLETPPSAVFVHRWRDRAGTVPPDRRYGLHDTAGTRRPAADVVAGFYSGTQRVFAFPAGTPPPPTPHGLLLLGWGLIALLAGLYAGRPFVRETALRYFAAHGFYRDAVREGRDVSAVLNALLLLAAAAALGLTATVLLRAGAPWPGTEHVLAALPSALRSPLAEAVAHPSVAGLVVGGAALAALGGWAGALVLGARANGSFSLGQGLMLVAWPCWPAFLGMVLALTIPSGPPGSPLVLGVLLVGGGLVTIVAVTVRILRDFWAVSAVAPSLLFPLTLASPLVLLLLAASILLIRHDLPVSLIWHLLTRT
jgi:hypothetical protein